MKLKYHGLRKYEIPQFTVLRYFSFRFNVDRNICNEEVGRVERSHCLLFATYSQFHFEIVNKNGNGKAGMMKLPCLLFAIQDFIFEIVKNKVMEK